MRWQIKIVLGIVLGYRILITGYSKEHLYTDGTLEVTNIMPTDFTLLVSILMKLGDKVLYELKLIQILNALTKASKGDEVEK